MMFRSVLNFANSLGQPRDGKNKLHMWYVHDGSGVFPHWNVRKTKKIDIGRHKHLWTTSNQHWSIITENIRCNAPSKHWTNMHEHVESSVILHHFQNNNKGPGPSVRPSTNDWASCYQSTFTVFSPSTNGFSYQKPWRVKGWNIFHGLGSVLFLMVYVLEGESSWWFLKAKIMENFLGFKFFEDL